MNLAEIENDKSFVKSNQNDLISKRYVVGIFIGSDLRGIKYAISRSVSIKAYCYSVYNQSLTRRNG